MGWKVAAWRMIWAPASLPGKMDVPRGVEGMVGGGVGERGAEGAKIREDARTRWGV